MQSDPEQVICALTSDPVGGLFVVVEPLTVVVWFTSHPPVGGSPEVLQSAWRLFVWSFRESLL